MMAFWFALQTKSTDDLGMKLETLVFLHLRKITSEVFYLISSTFDVDFCIAEKRKPRFLIQVCYELNDEKKSP